MISISDIHLKPKPKSKKKKQRQILPSFDGFV